MFLIFLNIYTIIHIFAGVLELADEADSKSVGSDTVRVRPPPPAPNKASTLSVFYFFIKDCENMQDIWQRLKNEDKPILLYGTGNGADKILNELERLNIEVSGVFASDGFVRSRTYRGFKVISLSDAEQQFKDFTALFSFGSDRPEVLENIKKIMSRHTLLAPEVPVAGGEIFNIDFARAHADELMRVYSLLADEQSRKTFEQTVLFKLDGDISRLFECEVDKDEPFNNILKLESNFSFLDLGAYNGDTVLDFIDRVGDFSCVKAVEPDKRSFRKLCENTKHLNIECVNAAVSEKIGSVSFAKKASRGSTIGVGEAIPAVSVDSLTDATRFDYIKLDVEGAELAALTGAENTIKRDKPKMRIAAYHKSVDYFTLPLKVLEYRDDYKIYMRHLPSVPAWDTDFYFV